MKSKFLTIAGLLTLCLMLGACGGNSASNAQVDELQKQLADLQNQVNSNQNAQQNQNYQQTQPYQQAQPAQQQAQPVQQQQQQQSIPQVPAIPQQQPYQPQMGGFGQPAIDVETAKANAASHAGFNVGNVTFVKQKYDFDDGIAKWEIDFVVNTTKYEYEVNATTGAIIKFEIESIYS